MQRATTTSPKKERARKQATGRKRKSTPARKNKPLLSWQALEYPEIERGSDWFWGVGLIAVSLTILALFYGNVVLTTLVLTATIALLIHALKKPREVLFAIHKDGIWAEATLYSYEELDSFGIDTNDEENPKLVLQLKKSLFPYVVIPLEDMSPEVIHEHISKYLPDKEHTEPLPNKLMEILGF